MHCETCGRPLAAPARAIRSASNSELRNPLYLKDLKAAMRALALPRRAWRDAIAEAFRDFEGGFLGPGGARFEAPYVDDHFPDDADQRWVSAFIANDPEDGPPRLTAKSLERVRLIDLYFRIRYPELAATFGCRVPANDNTDPDEDRW